MKSKEKKVGSDLQLGVACTTPVKRQLLTLVWCFQVRYALVVQVRVGG